MTLILNQPQAKAVYSALGVLNKRGGAINAYIGFAVNVCLESQSIGGKVTIQHDANTCECYESQIAFANAYKLH